MPKPKVYSEKLINAFLTHERVCDIMEETGLSRPTVSRYRRDEVFQKILTERKARYIEVAASKMQAGLSESVDILRGIINDSEVGPQTRVYAINTLFTACKNWTETADILRRIEALEAGGDDS